MFSLIDQLYATQLEGLYNFYFCSKVLHIVLPQDMLNASIMWRIKVFKFCIVTIGILFAVSFALFHCVLPFGDSTVIISNNLFHSELVKGTNTEIPNNCNSTGKSWFHEKMTNTEDFPLSEYPLNVKKIMFWTDDFSGGKRSCFNSYFKIFITSFVRNIFRFNI